MSAGEIRVVMTLDDTGFRQRITQNGRELTTLNSHLNNTNRSVNSLSSGFSGLGGSLRDFIISAALAKSAIQSIHAVTTGLALGIANTNGEIEKMTVLMRGLSKETTDAGKNSDAAKSMDYLFNMAKNTPVELKGLTNAFVKLKTTGIDPMAGALQTLVDANSHFGGTTDTLNHAAVAIQQMASKGKISMEELRQQLAEAIPNAAQLMARGMGMGMDEFYDKVTKGMVNSKEALFLMFDQMKLEFAGSAKAMMNTWVGLTSNLQTEWTLFQKTIGDASFFDEAKNAIREMIAALKTDEAKLFGLTIGKMLSDMVVGLVDATKWVIENRVQITNWVKAAVEIALIVKAVTMTTAALTALVATYRTVSAALAVAIPLFTTAIELIIATGSASLGASALMAALGVGMTALIPVVGALAIALGAGAVAWQIWGNAADKSMDDVTFAVKNGVALSVDQLDKLKKKQEELKNSGHGGEQGQEIANVLQQDENNNKGIAVVDLNKKLAKDRTDFAASLQEEASKRSLAIEEKYSAMSAADKKKFNAERSRQQDALIDEMAAKETEFLYSQRDASKKMVEETIAAGKNFASKDKVSELAGYSNKAIGEKLKESNDRAAARNRDNLLTAAKPKHTGQSPEEKAAKAAAAEAKRQSKAAAAEADQYANFVVNQGVRLEKLKATLNKPLTLGVQKDTMGAEEAAIRFRMEQGGKLNKQLTEQDALRAKAIDETTDKIRLRVKAEETLNSINKQQQTTMAKLTVENEAAAARLANGGYATMSKESVRVAQNIAILKERFAELKPAMSTEDWDKMIQKMQQYDSEATAIAKNTALLNHNSEDKILAKQINNSMVGNTKERLHEEYQAKVAAFMQEHQLTMEHYKNRINNSKELNEALAAMDRQYARSVESPIETIARSWGDMNQNLKDASSGWMQGFSDNLIQMVTTGKANFKDLTKSILMDIAKIVAQKGFSMLINSAASAIGGAFGGGFNGTEPLTSFTNSANGNVMTPMGALKLNTYAMGGIAKAPQVSIFGEGRTPEAYVPLPDGRSIPVTMSVSGESSGGKSGSPSVSIQINVDNTGKESKGQQSSDADWNQLAGRIKTITLQTIHEQKRSGGVLSKSALGS